MALNLKEIDFKQLMFQKGDRLAFFGAVLFMGLLIVTGIFIQGLGSGTASANADELAKLREAGKSSLTRSTPPPTLQNIDPELMNAGVLNPLSHEPWALRQAFFFPSMTEDNKWRQPEVLVPDEFQVDLLRGLARTYMVDIKKNTIQFISEKKPKNDPNQPLAGMAKGAGRGGKFGGLPGRLGGMGGGGMGDSSGSLPGELTTQGNLTEKTMTSVPLERLAKGDADQFGYPAESTLPLRMAIVQGAFPYKKQMEEFRRTLRFKTLFEMENEVFPEFLGLKVERRAFRYGSPNKVVEDWKELDLVSALRPYLIKEAEPEDPKLMAYGIVWTPKDRLVIPRPPLSRDEVYPDLRLESIKKVIEDYDKIVKSQMPVFTPPKTRFDKKAGFDEFENAADATMMMRGNQGMLPDEDGRGPMKMRGAAGASGMAPGMGFPGAGVPGAGAPGSGPMGPSGMMMQPGGVRPPAMGGMPPGGLPAGVAASGMVPPGMMQPGMTPGMGTATMYQDRFYPEKALVRFLDPTVKPGHVYEYKLSIRMVNPLFNREDKAVAKSYTTSPELLSKEIVIPQKLVVPPEFSFYMVAEDRRKGNAPNNGTWVQIHRWLEKTKNDWRDGSAAGAEVPVGDWSIAEQVPAQRGEYIGRIEDSDVAMWWPQSESFTFAARPNNRRKVMNNRRGIPVDFNTEAVLVDFQGGPQQRYQRKDGTVVEDSSELDALVLLKDGRLVVRSSMDDAENKDRKERVEGWRKWTHEVRIAKEGVRLRQMMGAGAAGAGAAGMGDAAGGAGASRDN